MSLTQVFSLSPFKMALEDTCRMVALCALIFFSVFYSAHANEKTLVLIDNANTKETHSIFFNSLKGELTQNILALNLWLVQKPTDCVFPPAIKLKELLFQVFQ